MHTIRRGSALPACALLLAVGTSCAGAAGPTAPPTAIVTPAPGPSTAAPSTATAGPTTAPPSAVFDHQPLWPFTDPAQVRAWQEAYRTGGHQPWHLDAGQTALSFTQSYLGFTGIDRVTTTTTAGDEAWIGVGFALPNGQLTTAAVVHLARYGSGSSAPWEVVGTRDTTLRLDTPVYGSVARSPLTVGGTVTGVDESLRLRVLGPAGPVGESCCLPAGGDRTAWSSTVVLTGTATGALTVVVSTGGHVADVERFAVTAVRPA